MKRILALATIIISGIHIARAQQLSSPDGKYTISVEGMNYSISYGNKPLTVSGRLGVDIDNRLFESALAVPRGDSLNWCSDLELCSEQRTSVDTVWTALYGENAVVRDHYNQLILHYEKGSPQEGVEPEGYDKRKFYAMDIIIRAYDEGIAFRYHFPETSNGLFLHVTGERTTFAFPEGTMAWYEEWAQGPYEKRPLRGEWYESERPLLLQLPDGRYAALLEASMSDYSRGKYRLSADNELQVSMYGSADIITPYSTPLARSYGSRPCCGPYQPQGYNPQPQCRALGCRLVVGASRQGIPFQQTDT